MAVETERVAAVGWDPGRWEEPLAGVWRAGWPSSEEARHPRVGGMSAGRAPDGSGSCFPERSSWSSQGFAEGHSGACEGWSIQQWGEREDCFCLFVSFFR